MDTELKAKWVEALRSGTYRQADGSLIRYRDGEVAFCCLGVLCDTQGTVWDGRGGDAGTLDGVEVRSNGRSYLSDEILERVGLTEDQQQVLAKMNDDLRPFPEIADYIEANL